MANALLVSCAVYVFYARFARVAVMRIGNEYQVHVLGRKTADD